MSLFNQYNAVQPYGMFGYPGWCCDLAIRQDRPDMARECWARGWMDYDTQMLVGTVGEECERRAKKVAKELKALGPTKVAADNSYYAQPVAA